MKPPTKEKQEYICRCWDTLNNLKRADCDFVYWLQLKLSCSRRVAENYADWFFASQYYKDWRKKVEGDPS